MKIIAFDDFKPGVTLDDLKPYLREEVSNVWRLWKAGIVRENYARADAGGVIIVFELDSIEEAKTREIKFAATSLNDTAAFYVRIFNEVFKTRFSLVFGYPGLTEACLPWSGAKLMDIQARTELSQIRQVRLDQ